MCVRLKDQGTDDWERRRGNETRKKKIDERKKGEKRIRFRSRGRKLREMNAKER